MPLSSTPDWRWPTHPPAILSELADGFSHDGTPDYTSLNYLGVSNGPLCINVDASQRSCNYAMTVDVALDQGGTVPEPGSLALFGLTGLALLRARRG